MLRRNGMSALADLQGMARGDRLAARSPVQGVALRAVRDHRAETSVKSERPRDVLRCEARPDQTAGCDGRSGRRARRADGQILDRDRSHPTRHSVNELADHCTVRNVTESPDNFPRSCLGRVSMRQPEPSAAVHVRLSAAS